MLSYTVAAITPTEATAYLSAAGVTGWPTVQADQEAAIIRGQRYVAGRYNARWLEEWTIVPDEVKYAIAEAALLEAVTPGSLSAVSNPSQDKVLVKVSDLAWERVKGAGGAFAWWPRVSAVEGLLAGLIGADAGSFNWLARA